MLTRRPDHTIAAVEPNGPLAVRVRDVDRQFGRAADALFAVQGVNLDVRSGEFLGIVGASGCGKTTLLHLISGLDTPTRGVVEVDGQATLMFQESALFPWLTAADNIALPLKINGVSRSARQERVAELLEAVQLRGFADHRPHELSGGMRQRVALARAFAQEADILCMDEPFGALDAMTRDLLHEELERLCMERHLTVVFVTHNVREAVRLSDRVVLLQSRPGRVAAEFPVDIPRPRRTDATEIAQVTAQITSALREEVRRHVAHH
ncbi:MAG: ABC transporter ATP-binding protein [Actinomycetes bacterium]